MTLYRLLRKGNFGFWGSGIFAAVFMILYGMMTGMGYSSFRAVSMFCILLLGQAVGRIYDSLNAMGFTALLIYGNSRLRYMMRDFSFLLLRYLVWYGLEKLCRAHTRGMRCCKKLVQDSCFSL